MNENIKPALLAFCEGILTGKDQNNLAKICNASNNIYAENLKLKLCKCAQSMVLGTRTKFQLEILTTRPILVIYKFRENILESSRNVCETPPVIW